jgi:hypothetical protein
MRLGFVIVVLLVCSTISSSQSFPGRIPPSQRKFNSTSVNALIDDYVNRMKDTTLASLFQNCIIVTLSYHIISHDMLTIVVGEIGYPNTLDTTIEYFVK